MSLKHGMWRVSSARFVDLQWWYDSDDFPSSAAFDAISSSLQSDDTERKDAVKKGNAIFAFTLKNKEGSTESWYIDLKEKGEVGKGDVPAGKKADGTYAEVATAWEMMHSRQLYCCCAPDDPEVASSRTSTD